ncbi:hypothetical protein GQ43DRAFT_472054 [Delitschia confertaspora ATCC 74209]|uniref:Uncharacterized protein n=1 Tax=Delitschia confertaspora ATCC 74209 TaxID=1513339 RepID=A0A9P4MYR4_9PLEO|nr:hypothetical protein GQ43DRAFT_472054 [Delitschia confertaspora ATCC 74209]
MPWTEEEQGWRPEEQFCHLEGRFQEVDPVPVVEEQPHDLEQGPVHKQIDYIAEVDEIPEFLLPPPQTESQWGTYPSSSSSSPSTSSEEEIRRPPPAYTPAYTESARRFQSTSRSRDTTETESFRAPPCIPGFRGNRGRVSGFRLGLNGEEVHRAHHTWLLWPRRKGVFEFHRRNTHHIDRAEAETGTSPNSLNVKDEEKPDTVMMVEEEAPMKDIEAYEETFSHHSNRISEHFDAAAEKPPTQNEDDSKPPTGTSAVDEKAQAAHHRRRT